MLHVDRDSVRLVGLVRDFTARLNRWMQDNAHRLESDQLLLLARRAERLRFAAQHSAGRASRVTEVAAKQLLAALPKELPPELERSRSMMVDELVRLRRTFQVTLSEPLPRALPTLRTDAPPARPRSRLPALLLILAMTILAWVVVERPAWVTEVRALVERWLALVAAG